MEDKKVKAGSVAVGICLFVIAILLVLIVLIVVFFYNATMEKNNLQAKVSELETTLEEKEKKVNELENKISKVSDAINDEEDKSEIKLGTFSADKLIDPSEGDGINTIFLKENNQFELSLFYGGTTYSGKYEVVGKKLTCTATNLENYEGGEYKGKTNDIFEFEIVSENELKFNNCNTFEIISNDVKYIYNETIILEGDYVIENSDFGYRFYKDGTVKAEGNISSKEGVYYTIGENEIEIKFNKETIYEEDIENPITKEINAIYKATIKDKNTLHVEGEEDGIKYEHDVVKF